MLKHCHATSFDPNRRSKRNLAFSANGDNVSNNGSSTAESIHMNGVPNENITSVGNNPHDSSFQCSTPVSSNGLTASTSFLTLNSIAQQKYSSLQRDDSRRSSYSTLEPLSTTSRTSSFMSLNNVGGGNDGVMKRTPIKIYAKCLRTDIEYKTLSISRHTTSTEVIWMLLSKFKMRHRDPKLFYLTMDIGIISHGCSSTGSRVGMDDSFTRTLVLEDDAYPAELKSCHPWGECRFTLQTRKGGLVRIHDSVLMEESKYKCLLISDMTTVNEVISILFHCYGLERIERVDRYELWEQSQQPVSGYERCLQASDCPVSVQSSWQVPSQYKLVLRRASKAFTTNTPLSTNSSSLSVTTSTSSLSSPRSSSVSPCSSTSSSVVTAENMSMSLSPSSANESETYSANDSDIIEEVDEEAMDTSYNNNNSFSPLSIHSMVRSSPSGASSSSSSISPSGSSIVPSLYSSHKPLHNKGAPVGSSNTRMPYAEAKQNQYSTPQLPPPLPPHSIPFQPKFQEKTTTSTNQNSSLCFNKTASQNTITSNVTSLPRSRYVPNQYSQMNKPQNLQIERNGASWIKSNMMINSSSNNIGQNQQLFNGGPPNHNSTLPKTNFNLNGPVSRNYQNVNRQMEQTSCVLRQQQGRPSIHESGLPSLRPKPSQTYSDNSLQIQQQQFSSLNFRSHNNTNVQRYPDQRSRFETCNNPYASLSGVDVKNNPVAFHEYENYFYI